MFYKFHSYNDCKKSGTKLFLFLFILCFFKISAFSQIKILFDNTHAETSGNSGDWTIDADQWNLSFNSTTGLPYTSASGYHSNPQKIPTPLQSTITASTPENYWTGCLSYWGVDCVKKGYTVETLPSISGKITYGDNTNAQDLSNYKVFVVCEPNIPFSDVEKTAILTFVKNGGGLYLISDHQGADRNNDGWDSPRIWNNLIDTNSVQVNPFGLRIDQNSYSGTSTLMGNLPATDSILHGPMGNVTKVKWSAGATMTISTAANPTVKAVAFKNGSSTAGSTNVLCAYARFGTGKVVAISDSSPFDDSTGCTVNPNAQYYNGYTDPTAGITHRNLIMNSTIWLAAIDHHTYTFTGNGNWNNAANWQNNLIPPITLPSGDSIIIDNIAGGQCLLNQGIIQHVSSGATMTVLTGKNLVIQGSLNIK